MLRGALSSFWDLSHWVGRWVFRFFVSLLLRSLANKEDKGLLKVQEVWVKFTHRSHQVDRRPVRQEPPVTEKSLEYQVLTQNRVVETKGLKTRKRGSQRGDDYTSPTYPLVDCRAAKRCRFSCIKEWRFCLPSSSELVGDEDYPLLSNPTDLINNDIALVMVSAAPSRTETATKGSQPEKVFAGVLLPPEQSVGKFREPLEVRLATVGTKSIPDFAGLLGNYSFTRFHRRHKETTRNCLVRGKSPSPRRIYTRPTILPLRDTRVGGKGVVFNSFLKGSLDLTFFHQRRGDSSPVPLLPPKLVAKESPGTEERRDSATLSIIPTVSTNPPVAQLSSLLGQNLLISIEGLLGGAETHTNLFGASFWQEQRRMKNVADEQVVQFSLEEVQSARFRASRTILGRLFTKERMTTMELREELLDAWKLRGHLKVSSTKFWTV
ncbi:unnamed protein product [Linum trigynum]|uniref:Uncharacterized protein n=1 Tax=Linum trigynum TaxID=586398 RepID=A0AAV2DPD3_9ROSI